MIPSQLSWLQPRLTLSPAASIKSVAADMAWDMMSFYKGTQPGQTPGLLPEPYYCELMIGKLIRDCGLMADSLGHRVGGWCSDGGTR